MANQRLSKEKQTLVLMALCEGMRSQRESKKAVGI